MTRCSLLLTWGVVTGCVRPAPVPEVTPPAPVPAPAPATGPATLAYGPLTRTDAGWTFSPDGATAPSPVPPDIAKVAQAAVGADSPSAFGLLEVSADGAVQGWRCVSLDAGPCKQRSDGVPLTLHGTEPFWSISIDGATATFSEMDGPGPRPFAAEATGPMGPWTLTPDGGGAPWTVTRADGACSDGMADALYTFTARVERGDAVPLRGCALDTRPPR